MFGGGRNSRNNSDDYLFLRSAPHFEQVRAGQNVTNGPFDSNTDVPQIGHLNLLRSHMFTGMRNTNTKIPNAMKYRWLDVETAPIRKPAAARKAAITDNKARVLRMILVAHWSLTYTWNTHLDYWVLGQLDVVPEDALHIRDP